jgi:hypothetical protein
LPTRLLLTEDHSVVTIASMKISVLSPWSGLLLVASCLISLHASAQLAEYSNLASWESAIHLAALTSINFQGLPSGGLPQRTVGGVDFQYDATTPGDLYALVNNFYYPGEPAELSAEDSGLGDTDGMMVTFSQPVTAISMDMEAFLGSDFTFTVNGHTYVQAIAKIGTLSFVGLVSDTPFTSFTVSSPYEFGMNFADLNYATPVPEPGSTGWMIGLGLFACRAFRRLHRRNSFLQS